MANDRQVAPDPRLSELVEQAIRKHVNHEWSLREYSDLTVDEGRAILAYASKLATIAAAVLLGGTPRSLPDDPPTVLTIEVEREDDGRCCASWVTGDHKEAGSGEYSPTIVGALANLCATLIKVDEDKAIERAACGGAASSPTPACRFMQPNQTAPCSEVRPGEEATWCMACLLSHQPAAPVRPVQEQE